ncbi:hypothetical protein B1F77_26920 [Pseudomonas syringae]|uniref:Uncharacterized protein n=1 Tax=Pseudomonas syringae TaxID=317 RepID=A0AB37ZPU3_PSESX|nr:hypothetical protein [Pseudomonas syringae]RXT72253.1 hypothetical protein B1F77_26920 [Pseudomonas syringae]RXT85333.1 hypothetical protein B1F72_13790 [Pseudomonas syringae]SDN47416.1 hypothetical protein SAMN05444505_108181 [Pseudomonas syringae]
MKVTNSGTAPWGVYLGGTIKMIKPGASRELALEGDDLVQARKIDALSFEEVVKPESDEKAELLAKLKALGIEAGKNSGIETLQKRLAEAEAAAEKQKVIDELTELKVEFDKEANLEALQAALAAAKA